ncbi:MAG: helix-turn-helix domain-containing protein [Variibacter sp.]
MDNWYLFLPLSKDQNSGEKQKTGKPIMESFANPFEYVTEDDAFVALFIPRNLSFMQSSRVEIRHESNLLLADYLLLLNRSLHNLRGTDVPYIVAATMSLLTACLTLSRDDAVNAQNVIDTVIFERASKAVAQRLSDPDLTPDRLCRKLGVSRSRLYRIFEPIGGVSSYIRRKRLLKTHDILVDSSDGRPISTIAAEWGFTDPSTYSRMFRKEFGITPKEARVEGWRGPRHTSWQQNGLPDGRAHTLSMLLLRNSFGL